MQEFEWSGKSPNKGKVIIFPGQGTQALGMGKEVCDISAITRKVWDCASDVSGIDVRKLCQRGPMTRLDQTRYQQLAVTTVNVAMFNVFAESDSLENTAFAGHSAGEYSALYAAGVFDLETVFKAIIARATIMQALAEQRKGAMYVIKDISHDELQLVIAQSGMSDVVKIANDNSPRQQVISGDVTAVKELSHKLAQSGYGLVKLAVNGAWHSHLMQEGVEQLSQALAGLAFHVPRYPVYMNLTASVENNISAIRRYLALHLTHHVRWRESMEACYCHGYRDFIEMGSKKIFGNMLMAQFPVEQKVSATCFSELRRQQLMDLCSS
ncbi:ACP S-malonyltransferase [Edaphovirga cremea]|uniref:ACP S-malonyltransferase n=1 Tax=Edaphovirga cremea TaxID=2267246 RepID=UPI0013009E22|nr:ACP S-malonyltransferase [Edaphovirga cremea]